MKYFILTLCFVAQSLVYARAPIPEKVVICGICRNVEKPLPSSIRIMEQIGALFEDYRIVVYENNSTDKTVPILDQWTKNNPKVYLKSETLSRDVLAKDISNYAKNGDFFHVELIARARNTVLDIALSDLYEEFPYVIWMDMDFMIPPALEGIVDTFSTDREWDAVFAYGVDPPGTFWDWYAFRDAKAPIGSELLGNYWWYMPKSLCLNKTDDWYPVYSAFGGCGIYKKTSIAGCRYSATVTEDLATVTRQLIREGTDSSHPLILKYLNQNRNCSSFVPLDQPSNSLAKIENPNVGIFLHGEDFPIWRMSFFVYQYPSVCEHVTFHASMIVRGHGKLFINPRMVFTYGTRS